MIFENVLIGMRQPGRNDLGSLTALCIRVNKAAPFFAFDSTATISALSVPRLRCAFEQDHARGSFFVSAR